MPDERTGSQITFLNSDLRSRTDVMSMVEQIKVIQYYSMQVGRTPKGRTPTHFLDFVQTLTETSKGKRPTDVSDEIEIKDLDEWTLDIAEPDVPPDLSTSEMTELAARFDSSLRLFDLKSSDLDILSERPQSGDKPKKPGVSGHEVRGKTGVHITSADNIDWD
ncbi:hypothetical protein RSAG8_12218, partial [Rhizoctonia solani AG-8 WAC10335]